MKRYDIILFIFWFGISLFVMVLSYRLGLGKFHAPGPGLVPFLIGVLLLVISFYLILRSFLKIGHRDKTVKEKQSHVNIMKIGIVVVSLFAYALFLETLGFLITTFLLLIILFKAAGSKRLSFVLIGSILTVLVTYFVFNSLGLRFPMGILRWM